MPCFPQHLRTPRFCRAVRPNRFDPHTSQSYFHPQALTFQPAKFLRRQLFTRKTPFPRGPRRQARPSAPGHPCRPPKRSSTFLSSLFSSLHPPTLCFPSPPCPPPFPSSGLAFLLQPASPPAAFFARGWTRSSRKTLTMAPGLPILTT